MIDIIKYTLIDEHITCQTMNEYLKNDSNSKVLILSSIYNASGIDLSHISNIIITEPFEKMIYGTEIEKQLVGRLHRINQKNSINVYKLIIKDTIEQCYI